MKDFAPVSLAWLPVAALFGGVLSLLFYALAGSLWATVPGVGLGLALTFLLEDHFSGGGRLRVKRALLHGGAGALGTALAVLLVH